VTRWTEAPSSRAIRRAVVAGSFYPGDPSRLRVLVGELLDAAARLPAVAGEPTGTLPAGVLVPHAGLVYSGKTAAAAWRRLRVGGDRRPTVVLLGTNHSATWLEGVGAWTSGAWRTPLGDVAVDEELAASIVALGPPFVVDLDAHDLEHSIEVQLPILQAVVPDARIVPLAVSSGRGPHGVAAGRRLGALLADRRNRGASVVLAISTDFAHYPADDVCTRVTELLAPAILAVDPARLADLEAAARESRMRGLVCGMCGIEPAVLGLAALRELGATRAVRLASATSADAGGPPERSVGYLSVRFDA
jgi:AmmeMemoRadiSam system protein B